MTAFDPTRGKAADFVVYHPELTSDEDIRRIVGSTFAVWQRGGAVQARVTIVRENPEPNDVGKGYPPGLWIEGWTERVKTLPFGEAEYEGGPISPPLTMKDPAS